MTAWIDSMIRVTAYTLATICVLGFWILLGGVISVAIGRAWEWLRDR